MGVLVSVRRVAGRGFAGASLIALLAAGSWAAGAIAAPTGPRPATSTAPIAPPTPELPRPATPPPLSTPTNARPAGAAAPPSPSALSSAPAPKATYSEAAVEPMKLYDEERCSEALPGLRALAARADFPADDAEQAIPLWDALAWCANRLEQYGEAHDALVKATAYEEASAEFWEARLYAAAAAKRWPDVLTSMETLAERDPALFRTVSFASMDAIWSWLEAGSSLETRFLEVIWNSGWQPDDPFQSADSFLIIHAERLRAAGDERLARRVLRGVTSPGNIYVARLHPGLKTFIPVEPSGMNIRATAERRVSALALRAYGDPDRIDLVLAQADLIRRLGRPAEALALLDGTRRRVDLEPDKGGYRDIVRMRGHWWSYRADVLFDLGRDDEALAGMAYAAALPEVADGVADTRNVTQVGQLADLQLRLGRYDEAIATLDRLRGREDVTDAGRIGHARIRACALAGKGDREGAARIAKRNAKLAEAGQFQWIRMQLCAGEQDAVAKAYIARLTASDGEKAMALEELGPYGRRARRTGFTDAEEARWDALRKRPDMAKAIRDAGGLEPWPMVP